MTFKVKAGDPFWRTVDLIDNPQLLKDVYDTCFDLLENGIPSSASPTSFAAGPVLVPAEAVDLPRGEGFLVCVRPEALGHDYIYVGNLIFYER